MSVYKRKLSDSERLWLGANKAFPPFANQFILEGRGAIDIARLSHAVETASDANPGSRLVLKGFLSGCYWEDSGITPPVRVVDGKNWDGRSHLNAPFLEMDLPCAGPTCEVVYIRGNPIRIAFRSTHAVMDGVGTFLWMEDIFRVLRNEAPIGSSSTISDEELIASVSDKKQKLDHVKGIAPTGKSGKKAKGTSWKRITVSGHHSNIIPRVAVALAKSAWAHQNGRFRVATAVDLRQRVECPRSTGNLSNTVYFNITKDSTPESVSEDLKSQLDQKNYCINIDRSYNISLVPIWLIGLIARVVANAALEKNLFAIPVCISNLGRADHRCFYCDGFAAESFFAVPLSGDGTPAFVAIGGLSDKIEIITRVPNRLADHGRLDQLVEEIGNAFR